MTSTTTRRAVALLAACTLSPSAAQEGPAPLPEGRPTQVLSVELRDLPGASRVRVTAAAPLQWTSSRTETGIVVELADAEPGPAVPYELSGGSGPVTRVRLHVRGGDDWRSVQLWIDTSGGGEPAVRAEGSSLEIDVPSSAPGTATADAPATLLHSFVPTPRHEPEPYRIAAGDLLEIDVLGFSELDRRVRVGDDGGVPLPLVGRVEVQGMSIEAAQERLAGALVEAEILNEPIVIVTLAQASRDTVAVHGAVNAPGLYVLPRPATVMEVLIWAGGLTDRVAEPHRAIVLRGDTSGEPRRFVDLAALLGGTSSEPDPMLHPGDALLVPVAEVIQVFLAGAVRRPGPVVAAPGSDLNVLEALAVVGGATERGSLDKVSVHRLKPFGRQTTIRVDVDATQRGRIPPLPLQTGDVVFVPFWPAFGQSYDVTAEELLSAPPGARAPGPSQP